jgi:hypothetical protein
MAAPNELATVQACAAATGDLINRDSTAFTDYVARVLHARDPRWGRKVRIAGDWGSRNNDALAYLDADGNPDHKDLIDIVVSASDPGGPPSPTAAPSWQVHAGPNAGNGAWMAPAANDGEPPPIDPPSISVLIAEVAALRAQVRGLERQGATLDTELRALVARVLVVETRPPATQPTVTRSTNRVWGHAHTFTIRQPQE